MTLLGLWLDGYYEIIMLAQFAVKATLVLAAAGAAAALMKNASAATRHWVWSLAFYLLLLLPSAGIFVPALHLDLTSGYPSHFTSLLKEPLGTPPTGNLVDTGKQEAGSINNISGQNHQGPISLAIALWGIWLVGSILSFSRTLIGMTGSVWLSFTGVPPEDEKWFHLLERCKSLLRIKRPVRIVMSEYVQVPVTFGVVRPAILIPKMADRWPEDQRRTIILHELAHIKRLDHFSNLAARVACSLYWFNPLVWIAARRLYLEREHACDDLVLEIGIENHEYAGQLLEIARSLNNRAQFAPGLNAIMHRTQLNDRMKHILSKKIRRHGLTGKLLFSTLAAALLVALPLSAIQVPTDYELSIRLRSFVSWAAEYRLSGQDIDYEQVSNAISEFGGQPVAADLIPMLNDDMPISIKMAALWTLGKTGSKSAFYPVLNVLTESDARLRSAAMFALHGIACDPAFVAITISLKDPDSGVRAIAAKMLEDLTHKPVNKPVIKVLAEYGSGYPEVFRRTLGPIEDRTAVEFLVLSLSDKDPVVRSFAKNTLLKIDRYL